MQHIKFITCFLIKKYLLIAPWQSGIAESNQVSTSFSSCILDIMVTSLSLEVSAQGSPGCLILILVKVNDGCQGCIASSGLSVERKMKRNDNSVFVLERKWYGNQPMLPFLVLQRTSLIDLGSHSQHAF